MANGYKVEEGTGIKDRHHVLMLAGPGSPFFQWLLLAAASTISRLLVAHSMLSPTTEELCSRLNKSGKQRQKQWRPRSKTGCFTCRIRRVKCDESKPSCRKCTSTGRKCDGYEGPSNKRTKSTLTYTHNLVQVPSDWNLVGHNSMENTYFNYFRMVTIPSLTGFFDSGIWSYRLPQVSHHYPALWHAMAALASLHWDFLEEETPITPVRVSQSNRVQFALRQHTKSIQLLREMISWTRLTVHDKLAILGTCIIYICLFSLQGLHWESFKHIGGALMICYNWRLEFEAHDSVDMSPLVVLLAQLDSQARPMFLLQQLPIPWAQTQFALPAPQTHFTSLPEAHESLEVHINNMLQVVTSGSDIAAAEGPAKLEKCHEDFRQWDERLARYLATSSPDRENKGLNILYLRRLYAKVLLCLDPSKGELGHDDFIDDYAQMLQLVGTILEDESLEEALTPALIQPKRHFSLESTVTEAFFLIAARCREPMIRQKALKYMKLYPRREGICGTMLALHAGEKLIEIERTACQTAPLGSCTHGRWVCANHRMAVLRFADLTGERVSFEMLTAEEAKRGIPGRVFIFQKTR
ncbi:hypothetical protein BO94DRAFT_591324 [Aspergillus sclerotioniger CBS 115572]|uniref:Zn(2)-C6 fungal-type domain-containing protein n=1 Tax=Aspergillus sclerotioniger CBS 115572 TaxID=1450535 RepID=A0A317UWA3_9EURO|nr:hypothetical protein BO94DRAFT_591324 [Aspergillus sclerotioniger CBS 115572]PWY65671.1 hypothetical protein BO94DRAFT_591324 [Aspergillus sclerotioniger CBS 115572]